MTGGYDSGKRCRRHSISFLSLSHLLAVDFPNSIFAFLKCDMKACCASSLHTILTMEIPQKAVYQTPLKKSNVPVRFLSSLQTCQYSQ